MKKGKMLLMLFSVVILNYSCNMSNQTDGNKNSDSRPNILLVVADDMGWTDLGSFGSEINTPNIDKLAIEGIKFTDYHVSVSCSPTRSMLMSGTDNHIAGLGTMVEMLTPEQKGKPGYEGYLNRNVVSMAELLKDGGYHTYMAGKWHLGHEPEQYPYARGFDKSYSMLYGGASYWSDKYGLTANQDVAKYVENDKEIDKLPKDFYATRNFTDYLMEAIRSNKGDGKPFLAYLAFTAVHDPLHVPEPWLSMYKGKYDEGYKVLKKKRIDGAKNAGVIPQNVKGHELYHLAKSWENLSNEEKAVESKGMEVYAGMITNMDYHIGRIIQFLKDIGEYENTIVVFMSDNGSNPWYSSDYPPNKGSKFIEQFDNSAENIGNPYSHYAYGLGWGSACSGPLDLFKLSVGEGGIRTPLIISGKGVKGDRQVDEFTYVTDIMPTILNIADIEHPKTYNGAKVEPMRGKSLVGVINGEKEKVYSEKDVIAGEMSSGKWVRKGNYKASYVPKPVGDGTWHLYDLKKDPGEINNLADKNPDLLINLKKEWEIYSEEVGVID